MAKCLSENHQIVFTPIKINLALHVTGQSDDGYHLLDSIVDFSRSGDLLQYRSDPVEKDDFGLDGPFAEGLSTGHDNLVVRARELMRAAFPDQARPVWFRLTKNLPLASGIGGGSGDAASVIFMLNNYWRLESSFDALSKIGLQLGADVPMCLSSLMYNKAMRVTGVGEKMTFLDKACSIPMVIVNHGQEISTPQIFKLLEKRDCDPIVFDKIAYTTLEELVALLGKTRNDLFEPALKIAPELKTVLTVIKKSGALFARMSGSGATCFGIYKDIAHATEAGKRIKHDHPDWFVQAIKTDGTAFSELAGEVKNTAMEKDHE